MRTYAVTIEPNEGGGFLLRIPEVAGVLTDADTPEEGLERIREALACAVGDDEAAGAVFVQYRKVG